MILPIGDAPNPEGYRPWVTWVLIAANVVVYAFMAIFLSGPVDPRSPEAATYVDFILKVARAQDVPAALAYITAYDLAVFEYGYRPSNPSLSDLFTSMFMHAGFAHLAGNMLYLGIYGDNIEHRMGRLPFLAAYLASGVVATLAFAAFAEGSPTPLVGASGAISGVLGLYFVAYPRNVVRLLILLPPFFFNVVMLPAWVVLVFYVLLNNLLPLMAGGASSVAYGAHLGGFAAGVLIALPLVRGMAWFGAGEEAATGGPRAQAKKLETEGRLQAAAWKLLGAMPAASEEERAELRLELGSLLARHGRRTDAYQHLALALKHPRTAPRAMALLERLGLDPRLIRRLRARKD